MYRLSFSLISFCLAFALLLIPLDSMKYANRKAHETVMSAKGSVLDKYMESRIDKVAFCLEKFDILINNNKNFDDAFHVQVEKIKQDSNFIESIVIAPGGVGKYSYPSLSNASLIGVNLFSNGDSNKVAQAKSQNTITASNPLQVSQGLWLTRMYAPIFTKEREFWGIVVLTVNLNKLFQDDYIKSLLGEDYIYDVSFLDKNNGNPVSIIRGDKVSANYENVKKSQEIWFGYNWLLSLYDKNPDYANRVDYIIYAIIGVLSFLISWLVWLYVARFQQKEILLAYDSAAGCPDRSKNLLNLEKFNSNSVFGLVVINYYGLNHAVGLRNIILDVLIMDDMVFELDNHRLVLLLTSPRDETECVQYIKNLFEFIQQKCDKGTGGVELNAGAYIGSGRGRKIHALREAFNELSHALEQPGNVLNIAYSNLLNSSKPSVMPINPKYDFGATAKK